MNCYFFNIGNPATTEWWLENLSRQVITAGFANSPGDNGAVILQGMSEGDRILAYCNRRGFVGAGIVGALSTYKFHTVVPQGSLSNHQHERHVHWQHAVRDVTLAVKPAAAGLSHASQTKQVIPNKEAVDRMFSLLARRLTIAADGHVIADRKYWHVLEAVREIGRPCSVKEISEWLKQHYPSESNSDVRDNATLLTVNDPNRRHHDHGRKDFRTNGSNPKDALYRSGRYRGVMYELYVPAVHGVWDIQVNGSGKTVAIRLATSLIQVALAEARKMQANQQQEAIGSIEDERTRALRSVVMREGQSEFRASLLCAYNRSCAVTGCKVEEILEAAHIHPYLGAITNRVDNGLLLRADIHTLFDKGLVWIDDGYIFRISKHLRSSEYEKFDGSQLQLPTNETDRPHPQHLLHHRRSARGAG